MKIIYENCGVKNYMKEDHRSYWRNFCSCEKKAWKNSGLYRIRTRDLYSTGAVQPCYVYVYLIYGNFNLKN